uniref:Uncharacterized protein n=1 Tax=Clytia hemisphaerica TaxID=252671 RepID=A0A7M6DLR0_9CNID
MGCTCTHLLCEEYGKGLLDVGCVDMVGGTHHMMSLLYNGRHTIDWFKYESSIIQILCRCKEIARQSEKTFLTFGIQFYGECWASELSLEDLLVKTTSSIHCVNVELVKRCTLRQSFDTRARICVGSANSTALYAERRIKRSHTPVKVDGGFSTWSSWSMCTLSCGIGFSERVRECNNPSPLNGGNPCVGQTLQTRHCYHGACEYRKEVLEPIIVDSDLTQWSSWSTCDKSCGIGASHRTRVCHNIMPQPDSTPNCIGPKYQLRQCFLRICN